MPVFQEAANVCGHPRGQCDICSAGSTNAEHRTVRLYDDPMDGFDWVCLDCRDNRQQELDETNAFLDDDEDDDDPEEDEDANGDYHAARITDNEPMDIPNPSEFDGARLQIPSIPNRPYRLCSIEQELGRDPEALVSAFRRLGLTAQNYVGSYGASHSRQQAGFVSVEHDSSCGGELVYGRLALNYRRQAAKLELAMQAVRDSIAHGNQKLDMRCGTHIHVDLQGASMGVVENLYHLWSYIEDPMFRIGSAFWTGHRSEQTSNDYAAPIQKHLSGKGRIGQAMANGRYSLNLSNYLGQGDYCRCGAFKFGAWEECSCTLPKATVEFRVFNATANVRKLRAYIALCQAMVGYAFNCPNVDVSSHTPMTFKPNAPDYWWTENRQTLSERLSFILNSLPLTDSERTDVWYCVKNSSLAKLGDETLATLAPLDTDSVDEAVYQTVNESIPSDPELFVISEQARQEWVGEVNTTVQFPPIVDDTAGVTFGDWQSAIVRERNQAQERQGQTARDTYWDNADVMRYTDTDERV